MSVHPQLIPDWSRHALAALYQRHVRAQARRFGLGDEEADEEADRQALRLCLEGKEGGTEEEVKIKFLKRTKYGLLRRKELLRIEKPTADFKLSEGDERNQDTIDVIAGIFGSRTEATQIEHVFVAECLRFLDRLPTNHRRVMRKLALGYSPVDIAQSENAEITDILKEIQTARDWVKDHVKFGE